MFWFGTALGLLSLLPFWRFINLTTPSQNCQAFLKKKISVLFETLIRFGIQAIPEVHQEASKL